uniref:Cyclic nucleotide-binding domain-containing protein n=1 Tax=Phaeomonas parva TaxID=124430 RepID=A0A6U4LLS2_9STRA|mmetsp:Transcript_7994/g.22817  ORF Transcript_7994/g.22817 Transcript_7994/m.22817 type:complete len:394 (+) Transcript_7994:193-1374(+)|eukprot:CAMPEP_0118877202 /NCGR_PEP_ID=MMETSP1163-20130328/17587_1 /TAXON_ID=124430 /ORGANISM="Phaeomonas parva, Strain CCMP2877" /LENGTH=393 /DNA_ID=CAMNT_0006812891 /DNA_START=111 /DNA_END=1292 /DNA_ORIENTATION=+
MSDLGTADVQAELQAYLNNKNINTLFIQIVESLLIEKPDNPIGFIVEYLRNKYPEQVGVTEQVAAANEFLLADDDEENSDDEDDEEDYLPEMEEMPKKPYNRGGGRRASVSAESVNPNAPAPEIAKHPKSDEECALIGKLLGDNVLFKNLEEEQLKMLQDAMFPVEFEDGATIIQQGDQGDNFYILSEGTVDCFVDFEGEQKKVLEYTTGGSFGELALLYNAPRAATCKATSHCKLYALDRVAFKVLLMQSTIANRNQYKEFLDGVDLLDSLNDYEKLTIADALEIEAFDDGTVVCRQGEKGDCFYIVKDGEASCTQTDASGEQVEVARLGQGNYFGEIALLTPKMRQATVTAVGQLKVMKLDRKTFKRVMGPLEEILKRNMEHYNKVRAQNI